jgi:hypothetical protein
VTDSIKQAAAECDAARTAERAARTAELEKEAALYRVMIEYQRTRYSSAYDRCGDMERRDKASALAAVAPVFERDAVRFPKRAKKAVEVLRLAVFLLDPKAPA